MTTTRKAEVRIMTDMVIHPGLVLIFVGILAMLVPKVLRKVVLAVGPFAALYAALSLHIGTDATFSVFGTGYQLCYMYVDKLSYVFCMIFALMACIGGIYSCHNENRMEALCSMSYAGCALGVTLAKDWMTMILFWEALAITSLFLIWCRNTPASRKAGFRYLLVHMLGGNLLLGGIFLKVSQGDFLITNLSSGAHDIAFWAILIGVAVNAAIPPVNAWLVDAYPEGTITGSVFLSSFTTKVAVYSLIRIFAGTELLMGFLRNPKYRISPVLKFIENHMVPLKKAGVVWGCDVQYMITGNANQHPRTAIAFTGEGRTDYDNFYTQITSYE